METEKNRDKHDRLSAGFQIVLIDLLNRVLKENGIGNKQQRLRVCEMFSEACGDFVDQGWFASEELENTKYYPLLCFAERDAWSDKSAGEIVKVLFPDPTSFLYESFTENCEWYFDENEESLGNIVVGSC